MADAPKLLGTDTLRKAYPKINSSIDNANEALSTANTAKSTADTAKSTADTALANSENTQTQLDTIVINGDSSVEAAQARVAADGTTYTTLQERLNSSDAQLAQKALKTAVRVSIEEFPRIEGETDDQPRIQRAVDYCVENGFQELLVQNKTYIVDNSIDAKGIKFVGIGKPHIPFMTWDYTQPGSVQDDFNKYLAQCKGSVIASDKDIAIFRTGLHAENIGLMGNRRAINSMGISQTDGGEGQQIYLNQCVIAGFGGYGIYAPYGLIFFELFNSIVTQNGKEGVYVDKTVGTYTGETNFFSVINSQIVRNESHGIFAKVLGRGVYIKNNSFERNGEPDDPSRPRPTNEEDVVYGAVFELYNSGAIPNGAFTFIENYSEETYGLLKLDGKNFAHGVTIRGNQWLPHDQVNYSCGILLKGWINKVSIRQNNFYSAFDTVKFADGNQIATVEIDEPYKGVLSGGTTPVLESQHINNGSFLNVASSDILPVHAFGAGLVTGTSYDSGSNVTYFFLDVNRVVGSAWDGYEVGSDGEQRLKGYVAKVGGQYCGVIFSQSSGNKLFAIRGDRSGFNLGDGSLEFVRVGGFTTHSALGQPVKLVVDWDGTIVSYGK